jgi:glucose/arabinose dehydrogenase
MIAPPMRFHARSICGMILILVIASAVSRADDHIPRIALRPYQQGLERPLYVTHDGTSRLFIVEQPGRIRLVKDGQMLARPYLDIVKKVESQGECGLLSVAFHPKFADNGYLYVDYTTRAPNLKTVIAEFKVAPNATEVDPRTERVLLTIDQPYPNHNGGQLQFGPRDGMLYIGMGDGGSAGDPQNRAQNPQELLGKILRIDIDNRKPYGIPKDNPFVKDKRFRPEIWTWGMRNPWRFSFDRETGMCYAGDVGQNLYEEVDVLEAGGNYGWRLREALHPFKPTKNEPTLTDPIKEYGRDKGVSVTGGYVYRGKSIASLVGWYVYGDYGSGRIWGLKYEDGRVTEDAELLRMRGQPSSFGEDIDGELYVCDHGRGTVLRIVTD